MSKNFPITGYQLETRTCKCPCKRTFRVLPASKQKVFSYYECNDIHPSFGRLEYTSHAIKKARKDERASLELLEEEQEDSDLF